jgi:hypothetical protein
MAASQVCRIPESFPEKPRTRVLRFVKEDFDWIWFWGTFENDFTVLLAFEENGEKWLLQVDARLTGCGEPGIYNYVTIREKMVKWLAWEGLHWSVEDLLKAHPVIPREEIEAWSKYALEALLATFRQRLASKKYPTWEHYLRRVCSFDNMVHDAYCRCLCETLFSPHRP